MIKGYRVSHFFRLVEVATVYSALKCTREKGKAKSKFK